MQCYSYDAPKLQALNPPNLPLVGGKTILQGPACLPVAALGLRSISGIIRFNRVVRSCVAQRRIRSCACGLALLLLLLLPTPTHYLDMCCTSKGARLRLALVGQVWAGKCGSSFVTVTLRIINTSPIVQRKDCNTYKIAVRTLWFSVPPSRPLWAAASYVGLLLGLICRQARHSSGHIRRVCKGRHRQHRCPCRARFARRYGQSCSDSPR